MRCASVWQAAAVVIAAVIPSTVVIPVVISAVVRGPPAPPEPRPRPRINIHIRVNIRIAIRRGGGFHRGFVDGGDQRIEHRVAGAGVLERNNLVGGQCVAAAGVLNLVHDDRVADMGLNHGLDFGQRRSGRGPGDGVRCRDASGQTEAGQRQKEFRFHIAT